ncbi:hypothetical protein [Streptomyces sp. CBMA29]|uniref:hypothetical protein n=1 Tax=Streptomyces sp. CBMA29 TaxID=1896314 RepID=UPI0016620C10|nr:hypothetical protein [Streptomyces sp. CBMA29]MBD0734109.1 hypothetical protein [Streptomyces sp. CBMA29]
MSFSIHAAGTVAQAITQVQAAEGYGDTTQFDTAKALILAELNAWPTGGYAWKGVVVEASGHHDSSTTRNLSITIRPLNLRG